MDPQTWNPKSKISWITLHEAFEAQKASVMQKINQSSAEYSIM